MQLTILLLSTSIWTIVVQSISIRGVSKQDLAKYSPTKDNKWACLGHPEIVLDFDQVNDNYCDCPDGSDEPGTSACYNSVFYCANEGHFPQYIPSWQVDDGVCDYQQCCDGSDEQGTVKCPNRCKELNDIYRKELAIKQEVVSKGLEKKNQLQKTVAESIESIQSQLKELQKELTAYEAELLELEANYDPDAERKDSILGKISPYLDQLTSKSTSQSDKIKQLTGRIEKLETILTKLSENYNPNFNDAAVKESIKNFQDYTVNKEEETGEAGSDSDSGHDSIVDSIITSLSDVELFSVAPQQVQEIDFFGDLTTKLRAFMYAFLGLDVPEKSKSQSSGGQQTQGSKEMQDLRAKIDSHNNRIDSLQQDLQSTNYGPDDILRAYKDHCITKSHGGYDYKICYTGSIHQQGNGNNVLIGKFSKFEEPSEGIEISETAQLQFDRGAKCWNGPIREAHLEIECGAEDELLSVTEPEVCSYFFKLKSPLACNEALLNSLQDKETKRDEL